MRAGAGAVDWKGRGLLEEGGLVEEVAELEELSGVVAQQNLPKSKRLKLYCVTKQLEQSQRYDFYSMK